MAKATTPKRDGLLVNRARRAGERENVDYYYNLEYIEVESLNW